MHLFCSLFVAACFGFVFVFYAICDFFLAQEATFTSQICGSSIGYSGKETPGPCCVKLKKCFKVKGDPSSTRGPINRTVRIYATHYTLLS